MLRIAGRSECSWDGKQDDLLALEQLVRSHVLRPVFGHRLELARRHAVAGLDRHLKVSFKRKKIRPEDYLSRPPVRTCEATEGPSGASLRLLGVQTPQLCETLQVRIAFDGLERLHGV